ncbi:MAG: extracellular solute-binding protein [Spirochaetes bacterium]|nr:extracellular solute-binding protein [Spirochaetota bacterium]MBU0954765.1 extracellular solute-binding protein [Spirochaetota bacterium]
MKSKISVFLIVLLLAMSMTVFANGDKETAAPAADAAPAAAQPGPARTINVLLWDDPYPKALQAMLPEFTAATGITVNIEMLQPPQVLTKTAVAVTATSTDYDVVGIDEGNVPVFASLLEPFNNWPAGKFYPKTDPNSVTPKMYSIGTWNGVQLGIPINGNLYVWMTRKDLIENPQYKQQFKAKYGYDLGIPKTFQELLDMGTFFHTNGIASGFGPFNGGPAGVLSEAVFMWESFGTKFIDYVDGTFKVVLNEDRAVEGIEFYKKLMAISPAGAETMAHVERQAAFAADPKGVFSMFIWPAQIAAYENPDTSMVAGKIAYSAPPAGPRGQAAVTGAWALAIPSASKNKDAAAEFIYWWSSKSVADRLVQANTIPARTESLTNPAFTASKPQLPALAASMQVAASRPRFKEIGQVQDVVKNYWIKGITGAMPTRDAIRAIVKETNEILQKAGY